MAIIIKFPIQQHQRSSAMAGTLAAKRTIRSAVRPEARARSVSKTDCQCSSGMRSRAAHLLTDQAGTDTSAAMAACEGQSPMISRNEEGAGELSASIPAVLGQSVLKSKAKLSYDYRTGFADTLDMTRMSETEERLAFVARVKRARMARFDTQGPICRLLDLAQGTYKQYETRTPLPHRLIPKFCDATGVSMEWLLTGEGEGPPVEQYPRIVPKAVKRSRRARRSHAA